MYINLLKKPEYDFLYRNEHLENNIFILGLGGSHAYGTNIEGSDIDIRGGALNTKEEILTNNNFEQAEDKNTDTVIYGFNKLIHLLSNCNPNVIEILGLKPEHYLYVSDIGTELLKNSGMFLSRRAIASFGGYAKAQLLRLMQKAARNVGDDSSEMEKRILDSINRAMANFNEKYAPFEEGSINLYIDKSERDNVETEIFMDACLKHYPLRDYKTMWSEMNNIVKDYARLKREPEEKDRKKICKFQMHLVRLFMMSHDILANEKIVTYREKEHGLLMDIRNGKYMDDNKQPTKDFLELTRLLEEQFNYDKENTSLPENPDFKKINEFMASVNERVVTGKIKQKFCL